MRADVVEILGERPFKDAMTYEEIVGRNAKQYTPDDLPADDEPTCEVDERGIASQSILELVGGPVGRDETWRLGAVMRDQLVHPSSRYLSWLMPALCCMCTNVCPCVRL